MATTAALEHVAIEVRDIGRHVEFLRDVLGMGVTEVDGDAASPRQVWTAGGIQLISAPDLPGMHCRLAHLGLLCDDVAAGATAALARGAVQLPQGPGWLRSPDGLGLELLEARPGAVEHLRTYTARH